MLEKRWLENKFFKLRKLQCSNLKAVGMFGAKAYNLITFSSPFSSAHHPKFKAPMDMAARDGRFRVFIVAGEVSGDSIASRLMTSLKLLSPFPVRFSGIGG